MAASQQREVRPTRRSWGRQTSLLCHLYSEALKAVIGAGAAGLVTARELVREGHLVTVFEQSEDVGGVWNYSEDTEEDLLGDDPDRERVHSSLYASVRTNLPREIMSFSDWPFIPEAMHGRSIDSRRFCCHQEVLRYLAVFASHFDVRRHIKFGRRVISVDRVSAGGDLLDDVRWRVSWTGGKGEVLQEKIFDAVVCCIGTYSQPNLPDSVRGIRDFPGVQLHCHNFRRPESFTGRRVLVVGASFSGDEIARLIARSAKTVYHTARTWYSDKTCQPRPNLERVEWLTALTEDGKAIFSDGRAVAIDAVMYCTGYKYCLPFLENGNIISTDDGHVHPVYKHIFVPSAPSLCFVGLLWKSIRFPQFELQAKLVARVLSGRAVLPSRAAMEADITRFYGILEAANIPRRYVHSHGDSMPIGQWAYHEDLAAMCGEDVPNAPRWRRRVHETLCTAIFDRPDTFRDAWTPDEEAVLEEAARECSAMLGGRQRQQGSENSKRGAATAECRLEAEGFAGLPRSTELRATAGRIT